MYKIRAFVFDSALVTAMLTGKETIVFNEQDGNKKEFSKDEFRCLRKELKRVMQKKDQENNEINMMMMELCKWSLDRGTEELEEYKKKYRQEKSKAEEYEKNYLEEKGKAEEYEKKYLEEKGKAEEYHKMYLQLKEEMALRAEKSRSDSSEEEEKLDDCSGFSLSDWFLP
mmetsp:Transcript_10755/g.23713  ORF Transcript_10755/g.23713 Transcript_10755/m.23713 type:complete len:170 (+) Transcript_10755:29-538(+)